VSPPDGDPWVDAFPWLAATGAAVKVRKLLEQAEQAYRHSAIQLRAAGQPESAIRVERFAASARWALDEPAEYRRLHDISRGLHDVSRQSVLADRVLAGALSLTGAERGNVQLIDPATGGLRIAAQAGFEAEFLEYFALVIDDDRSACGRAARQRAQVMIADVTADDAFAAHLEAAAAAGFRAVWSVPLADPAGRLLGVVSTHYRRPWSPPRQDLWIMERYAELAAREMSRRAAAVLDRGPIS
jgi:GAF domain